MRGALGIAAIAIIAIVGCSLFFAHYPEPVRLGYLSTRSQVQPEYFYSIGYQGYVVTEDPARMHAVINGVRYTHRDEPEYHPDPEIYFRKWLAENKDQPRFIVYHDLKLAKEKEVFDDGALIGYDYYPGVGKNFIDTFLRMAKMRGAVRQFLQDYPDRPVVGVIQTFNFEGGFPSVAVIKWQEAIWIEEAGNRLVAIAHFIWDAPGVYTGADALEGHPEAWPENL